MNVSPNPLRSATPNTAPPKAEEHGQLSYFMSREGVAAQAALPPAHGAQHETRLAEAMAAGRDHDRHPLLEAHRAGRDAIIFLIMAGWRRRRRGGLGRQQPGAPPSRFPLPPALFLGSLAQGRRQAPWHKADGMSPGTRLRQAPWRKTHPTRSRRSLDALVVGDDWSAPRWWWWRALVERPRLRPPAALGPEGGAHVDEAVVDDYCMLWTPGQQP